MIILLCFFFSSRRRHTRCYRDWSSDVCSSDLHFLARQRRTGHPGEAFVAPVLAVQGEFDRPVADPCDAFVDEHPRQDVLVLVEELQERLFEQHSARVAERPLPRAVEDVHAEVETDDGKKELRIVGGHAVMREIRFRHLVIGKSSRIRQEAWLIYLSKSIVGNTLTGNSSQERAGTPLKNPLKPP